MRCFRCGSMIQGDRYYEANDAKFCFGCRENTYVSGPRAELCCACGRSAELYVLGNWYCGECSKTMFKGD